MRKIFVFIILLLISFVTFSFAEERLFEIKAKKFNYTPNIIKVNKGDTVKIRLISEDVHHGFFLDGYKVETSAHPGQEGSVKFVVDKTGRFNFRCSVTCGEFHPYMVGYLVVGPNSRFLLYTGLIIGLAVVNFSFLMFRKEKEEEKEEETENE
ncbi:MAG: cupredoxin domain-containing protein [Candidatus Omnitrophota bacterium]